MTDSAGIVIVQNHLGRHSNECTLSAEPAVDIGSGRDSEGAQLFRVFDGTVLDDGRIAVLNESSGEVLVFDPGGRFLQSVGRTGGGPGEFRKLLRLWSICGDTLVIADYAPWRFGYFTADGEYLRSVVPEPRYLVPQRSGLFSDRGLLLGDECCATLEPGYHQRTLYVIVHSERGELLDTIARLPSRRLGRAGPPQLRYSNSRVFEPRAVADVVGNLVIMGRTDTAEIRFVDRTGQVVRIARWTYSPLRVTGQHLDAVRDSLWANRTPSDSDLARINIDPSRPVNDVLPAFASLIVGRDRRIWIEEYATPLAGTRRAWIILDESGRFECRIELADVVSAV